MSYRSLIYNSLISSNSRHTPTGTFEEKLEPALQFLANPWKLWETGQIALQRVVLRLAFKERLAYHQIKGARTPQISLPFKAIGGDSTSRVWFGALTRETSNALFEVFEDWNHQLKQANIEFEEFNL